MAPGAVRLESERKGPEGGEPPGGLRGAVLGVRRREGGRALGNPDVAGEPRRGGGGAGGAALRGAHLQLVHRGGGGGGAL
eukprot:483321-Prorocentrum_minimum.AAC.1